MGKRTKRCLGVLLALVLVLCVFPKAGTADEPPAGPEPDDDVELIALANTSGVRYQYYDANGNMTESDSPECTVVESSTTDWKNGWYVVNFNATIGERITVTGDVHLILADGATLTASKGITVEGNNSLTIYAQSTGNNMGKLIATADNSDSCKNAAGIGGGSEGAAGGTITIHGGNIKATGNTDYNSSAGAGIGGGKSGAGGTITIHGGEIEATGGNGGAGIGGGWEGVGGEITINGGTVIATGYSNESDSQGGGAGIGGGIHSAGGTITINDGTVTAKGGTWAAGIGGGGSGNSGGSDKDGGNGGTININGGTVEANGSTWGAGIGGGSKGAGGKVTISGGEVTANGGNEGAGIGGGSGGDGGTINIGGGTVKATGDYGAGIGGGWKGIGGTVTIGDGDVTATGGDACAGIGGGAQKGGEVTISGGTVKATGGSQGAGIGGGSNGDGATVTVKGGTVTATGGNQAAGIGGGFSENDGGNGGKVVIEGGAVETTGGAGGAGIGGGGGGSGGKVTISGGDVTATGGYSGDYGDYSAGAGIGGGDGGNGGEVNITGGTVTAVGKYEARGIGAGRDTNNAGLSDGTVTLGENITVKAGDGEGSAVYIIPASRFQTSHTQPWVQTKNEILVTKVTVSPATATLTEGETTTLTASVEPSNASDKSVTWSSSNTSVATVDENGTVTAVTAGKVTITATANDGSKQFGSCEVTVNEAVTATLTFDLNGGTLDGKTGSVTITAKVGSTINLPNAPTRDGYTFKCWKGSEYAAGAEYKVEGDHSFAAEWTNNELPAGTCTVGFDANDGAGHMDDLVVDKGSKVTLPANTYTREGYTFTGWNTNGDGTGTAYADKAEVEVNSNMTLYAQWKAINYKVHFDGNGGTGSMEDEDFAYDEAKALSPNKYTLEGWTFIGWRTTSEIDVDAPADYADGEVVKNLSSTDGATVNLYAQYSLNAYLIHFDKNADDATGTMLNQGIARDVKTPLCPNAFERVGYVFEGWNTESDGSGTSYSDKEAVLNIAETKSTINLYAQWRPISYRVHFDGNGGQGSMDDELFAYDEEKGLTPNAYVRPGLIFVGWRTTPKEEEGSAEYYDGEVVSNLTSTDGATVVLYAQWSADAYLVHFDKNADDATGTMLDQGIPRGRSVKLFPLGYSREGYTFAGWDTKADGTGARYANMQEVLDLAEAGTEITLYAQWKKNTDPSSEPAKKSGNSGRPATTTSSGNTLARTGDPSSFIVPATLAALGVGLALAGKKRR